MNLYSTYSTGGEVIFENDNFLVGFIKSCPFAGRSSGNGNAQSIIDSCKTQGVVHTNGRLTEYFAPRNVSYLVISKRPFSYIFEKSDLDEIDSQAKLEQMGSPLGAFNALVREAAGKEDSFDSRKFFFTAHVKGSELSFCHTQLNPAGKVTLSRSSGQFQISAPSGNSGQANGICFSNNFEMIYVPLDDADKALNCVERVIERAQLPGRVSSHYIVLPVIWDEPQACIRVRQLDNMSTKDMMSYFGLKKKNGSKMETLSSCLGVWAKKVPMLEVGDVFYVQINTQAPETPIDVEPTDWILSRSSHFQIIHSDQPAPEAIDMFIRVVDKPVDDFAAALFTMFEAQKKPIAVVGLSNKKIDRLFNEVRSRVNQAAKV